MVSRAIVLSSAIFLVLTAAHADLKLAPEVAEYELDGAKMKHLVFMDGLQRVTYTPPAGWDYQGNSNLFVLRPPHSARSEATIRQVNLARPESFDSETTKRLTNEVLTSAPKGSTNVGIVSQEMNPLMIERKETFLVIIKYDSYGESYRRSVMFLNRGTEQMRFQLTAPQSNFPELQKAFQVSHFTWQNL
jgi:hypothetical protein